MAKFDLHMHTLHSDGIATPTEVVEAAKAAGMDGIAITDHDTMEGVAEAERAARSIGIMLVPGVEITTEIGDILAYGISSIPAGTPLRILDAIHGQGGAAAIAHPCGPWLAVRFVDMLDVFAGKIDALETYNAGTPMAYNVLAMQAAKRHKLGAIAGSDAHTPDAVGAAFTGMNARSAEEVVAAIRKGATKVGWR